MSALFSVGDEVRWIDPDDGACSRWGTITRVQPMSDRGCTVYTLDDELEVFEYELG